MPHLSRNKLSKKTEDQLLHTLDVVLARLTKEIEVKDFLLSLLSSTERLMLAKRLATIVLLKEGFSQVEIAQTLHITRETVSRITLLYETKGTGYSIALQKLADEKVVEDLKTLLINLARYSVRASGGYVKSPFAPKHIV